MEKNDIREVREAEGMSGRSLASKANIPTGVLSEIERFERKLHKKQRRQIEAIIGPVRVWLPEIDIPRGDV